MKKIVWLVLALAAVFLLGACTHLTTSLTYRVETGDNIKVTVDAKAGYTQNQEAPFTVSKDGEKILMGTFITLTDYDNYVQALTGSETPGAEILNQGERDGNPFIFYEYQGQAGAEYNYVLKIKDSNTGVLLGSQVSREAAEACFQAMSFEKA